LYGECVIGMMKNKNILICIVVLLFQFNVSGSDIYVTGSWSLELGATDLISGAGSGYPNSFQSSTSQISLEIDAPSESVEWEVYVAKRSNNWHPNLSLGITRMTTGGNQYILDGQGSPTEINGSETYFFSGQSDAVGIECQLQIEGTSLAIPPDTYTTTVYYLVIDQ
jgi:hypothetical protein